MKALSITQLKKTYGNGFEALKGIDLSVEQGDFFALLGPNGAGKSTAIGIITSLVNKSGGTVEVFGHSIDTDLNKAKQCIGLVPQEFNFNQFEKVQDIVINQAGYYGVPKNEAAATCETLLKQLDLWEKRDQPSRSLSGGMKRRLMIARALVHKPQLLILDEPTAGVDIELRRSMWIFLQKLNASGTTIILTTHYLEEAENLCRNVAIINHGEIVENTSVRELIRRLDIETFVLDVEDIADELPKVTDCELTLIDDHTIEITMPTKLSVTSVIASLKEAGIVVKTLKNKANRLEELFVRLVEKQQ